MERILDFLFERRRGVPQNETKPHGYALMLDYPVRVSPRWGYEKPRHPQISKILEAGREDYARRLSELCKLKGRLSQIPDGLPANVFDPCWGPQRFFSSLDAIALCGMIVEFRPCLTSAGMGVS